ARGIGREGDPRVAGGRHHEALGPAPHSARDRRREAARLEGARGVGAFFLEGQLRQAILRAESVQRHERRAALTERHGRFAVRERQPLPIAPHGPAPLAQAGLRVRAWRRPVADEVRLPAALTHAREAGGVARCAAGRTLERPRECHGHAFNRSRTRSASLVEKPGSAAISAGVAVLTPASEPERSSSTRRRAGPMPGTASSSEVMVRWARRLRLSLTAKPWGSSRARCSRLEGGPRPRTRAGPARRA